MVWARRELVGPDIVKEGLLGLLGFVGDNTAFADCSNNFHDALSLMLRGNETTFGLGGGGKGH